MLINGVWRVIQSFCLKPFGYCLGFLYSVTVQGAVSTAFYYGTHPPIDKLVLFDRVVVEAENLTISERKSLIRGGVETFAYVSLGEVNRTRQWFDEIQKNWIRGENNDWNSVVIDLNNREWHRYLIEKRLLPLWNRGYHGFFLDTLDSYMTFSAGQDRKEQRQGLVDLITSIHRRFPGVKLILNRGFEVIPNVFQFIDGVVAESLFQRWNPVNKEYVEVPKGDRDWLLSQLNRISAEHQLPVTVIDYLPNSAVELSQSTAKKIEKLGFSAWISVPELDSVSVGMQNFLNQK